MRLTRLSITNFRSISARIDIDVPSQHVVLVGSNNAGKSNVLTALEWVLGNRTPFQLRPTVDDYFDPTSEIVIEAEIGDVGTADRTDLMAIATSQQQRGALSKKTDPTILLTLTISPLEAKTGDDEDEEDAEQESQSCPTGKGTLLINYWGFPIRQKATERRRQVAQVVGVGIDRNVGDDLQAARWTPYGQLMKAVLEGSPHYDEIRDLLDELNGKIQAVFTEEKASLLSDARVVSYVEDIDFQLTKENNPAELLRYLEVFVTEGSRRSNITRHGTGTQSAVIIGMLELALRQKTSQVRVFAVEEPDAFIHPHGVRRLAGLVQSVGSERGIQVILSTHSPALVAGLPPRDIVRVDKGAGRTMVVQSPGTLSDPAFARFVNQDTAEMFFAKRVVLVEGDTERFLLPPISSLVTVRGKPADFDLHQISVVSMDTKDNIVNFLRILDEFEIETRAVLDADFLGGTSCGPLVAYLRGRGKSIDDSNDSNLRKSLWAQGILVLQRGEIENYVPESDVAAVSGRPLSTVQTEMASSSKMSNTFKKLFGAPKPVYARQLAEHYVGAGVVPADLGKLITRVFN